jgi:tetratricopeptide (TPR) repeat protein
MSSDFGDEELERELTRALSFGDEGDWEGMADLLGTLLEEAPEDSTILCWLGVAEHGMGLGASAYDRFKACLSFDPTDPYILATAGMGLARYDDPDAESALRNAAVVGPNVVQARVAYGGYLAREGMSKDAMEHLDAALAMAPDDPEVLTERGVALALAGRQDEAAESFHAAWELEQDDGWARSLAGLAELEAGRFEEAVGDLMAAVALCPDDVEIALATALAASAIGRDDLAYEALEGARMRAEGLDASEVVAAEELIDEGAEASRNYLTQEFVPGIYRQRLMERP